MLSRQLRNGQIVQLFHNALYIISVGRLISRFKIIHKNFFNALSILNKKPLSILNAIDSTPGPPLFNHSLKVLVSFQNPFTASLLCLHKFFSLQQALQLFSKLSLSCPTSSIKITLFCRSCNSLFF